MFAALDEIIFRLRIKKEENSHVLVWHASPARLLSPSSAHLPPESPACLLPELVVE